MTSDLAAYLRKLRRQYALNAVTSVGSTGGLTFAESTVPTVKGAIHTRWEKIGNDRLLLALTVALGLFAVSLYVRVIIRPLREAGNLARDRHGNLTKINYDNIVED